MMIEHNNYNYNLFRKAIAFSWRWMAVIVFALSFGQANVFGAEMSVRDMLVKPNGAGSVRVWGAIEGKPTVGWTVLLEITPREGSRGTITFTSAESGPRPQFQIRQPVGSRASIALLRQENATVDIRQVDDVWPGTGTFSPFDTSMTKSARMNGAVDDNGTFVSELVTFSGQLGEFPFEVSPSARGVWDVKLSTASRASGWEGVQTILHHATITVSPKACRIDQQCRDNDACTLDRCDEGVCRHDFDIENCTDDSGKHRPGSRSGRSSRSKR